MKNKQTPMAILIGLVAIILVVQAIIRANDRQTTKDLCTDAAKRILEGAKLATPEWGEYSATLDEQDVWGSRLSSTLKIAELENFVTVTSAGLDEVEGTRDDVVVKRYDTHYRKGIEIGAHSVGKGLASGVVDGLADTGAEQLKRAGNAVKTAKKNFTSKFKKYDK